MNEKLFITRRAMQAVRGAIQFILQFFLLFSSSPSNAIAIILMVIFPILAIAKIIVVIITDFFVMMVQLAILCSAAVTLNNPKLM